MNRVARDGLALIVLVAFCWAVIAIAGCEPLPIIGDAMSQPTLAVVGAAAGTLSPAEAALIIQQQAKAAAAAAEADVIDALRRAAEACAGVEGIDAAAQGIRNEARIIAPKLRDLVERLEAIRGRG